MCLPPAELSPAASQGSCSINICWLIDLPIPIILSLSLSHSRLLQPRWQANSWAISLPPPHPILPHPLIWMAQEAAPGSSFPLLPPCFSCTRNKLYIASAFITVSQIYIYIYISAFASRRSPGHQFLVTVVILLSGPKHADERFFPACYYNGVISSMDAFFSPRDPHNFSISFLAFLLSLAAFPSN